MLVLSNGELVTVEWVQHELLESPVKVYNFEVEDFHTYFVGENSVLAHNRCETWNEFQHENSGKGYSKKEMSEKWKAYKENNNHPYAHLEDSAFVGEGKDFTYAQKKILLEENMKRNNGVVMSDVADDYYSVLSKPKKSMKGVTPNPDEWQFDHIIPKSKGGTNSYSNCRIVSRKYNRQKWDK